MEILCEPYWLKKCLNEVRPGRPEQSRPPHGDNRLPTLVSMKSGLEDRNNPDPLMGTTDCRHWSQ